ncbi:MAG: SUMF1/EgtB/PvdO family nonheme iron enzyme [Candidatus Neomarinimicrobiota bacterium]
MIRTLISFVCINIIFSCAEPINSLSSEDRFLKIENNLIKFSTLSDMIQGTWPDTGKTFTLQERMEYHHIPGAAVAVINDYKIEVIKNYGLLETGTNNLITNKTLFEAGSTTKLITSVITLNLVEKGILNLNRDVNEYLKKWKVPKTEFTIGNPVTLQLLLTHQSGLNKPDGGFGLDGKPTLIQVLNGESPARNEPAVIEFPPGSEWQYSNMGYVLIQLIVEEVTGTSFAQIADEIIFTPLEMHKSTFFYSMDNDMKVTKAIPHDSEGVSHNPIMHPSALAQGGLLTNPADLAIFTLELMKAYKGRSEKILSKSMTQKLFSSELDLDPDQMFGLKVSEGLGVFLIGQNQTKSFFHPGSNYPGFETWLAGYPESGDGFIVMSNGANGSLLAMEMMPALIKEYKFPIQSDIKQTDINSTNEQIGDLVPLEFVLIPGGSFEMGDLFEEGDTDEKVHTVIINDFYLSTTEVTYAQFSEFCEKVGREKPRKLLFQKGNYPVARVTWTDAQAFCDYYGYRLPTEAEWEYAAREGGKKVRFGNGKDIARFTEINFNAKRNKKEKYSEVGKRRGKPTPVKTFPPNSLGLYDMSGNQAEWCQDWYGENFYNESPKKNPVNLVKSEYRVCRGGSWGSSPWVLRISMREARIPGSIWNVMGFRVVRNFSKRY